MKPINTSTFDFPTLINKGCVYVDKTAQIYELVKPSADDIYFFPRPRRFGKSLLLSTLKALFQGRRELFKGLAIDKIKAWDWEHEVYPVLHLDMSKASCSSAAGLEEKLSTLIEEQCRIFGVRYDSKKAAATNFVRLLDALPGVAQKSKKGWWSKKPKKGEEPIPGKYVVLIDEYDAPIAGLLDSPKRRDALDDVRKALHDFYVVAKANCGDMRFLMVTGVSKFAKTSIFSAFNNPVDLSLDARAADLVGYTHEEMERHFHEHVQAFADKRGHTYDQAFAELLLWYDSYQFSPDKLVKVVNPVSLGNALSTGVLKGWWEATAGSTLIVDALKAANKAPFDFADEFSTKTLDAPDALEAPTVALLYQGGYLTIDQRIDDETVLLKIPNHEVRQSLETGYVSRLLGKDFELDAMERTARKSAAKLAAEGYTDSFKTMLQSAYSRLPHDWIDKDGTEIKRYFLAFMIFANAEVVGEPQHASGRPDAVMRTDKGIYIFEFKYAKSAKTAIKQCYERNYAAAFVHDPRPVYYVGVNYSPRKNIRTINDMVCEQVKCESVSYGLCAKGLVFLSSLVLCLASFFAARTAVGAELPDGYVRLSGLSSDFGPYVNTGYNVTTDDVIVVRMFVPRNQGTSGCKVAFGWSDNEMFNTRVNGDYYCRFRYLRRDETTRNMFVSDSGFFNREIVLTCTAGGMSWTLADGTGGASYSFSTSETENATAPLCIFARNEGADPCAITVYSFKVTSSDGTETKLDLVPCVSPDGTAGLYNFGTADLPGGRFLKHAGEKAFHASDGVILSSLTGSFGPYVKTDYSVKSNDVITVRMNAPSDQGESGWKAAFGWSDNEIFNVRAGADATKNGKYRYLRRDSTNRSIAVTDKNFFDQDIILTCDGNGMAWTKADGTGGAKKSFITAEDKDAEGPLFVFSRSDGNDRCALTLHSLCVDSQEGDGIKLVPFLRWDGALGLLDRVTGKLYTSGSSDEFTSGSELCEVRGSTMLVGTGVAPVLDWSLYGIESVVKQGSGRLEAGSMTDCPALEIQGGSCSLSDGTARQLAVTGALTLAGGTALTFDVTSDGSDSIVPATVDLSAASVTNPVTVNVMYRGLRTIGSRKVALIAAGLAADDASKFSLNSFPEVPLKLEVRDGALVLSRKEDLPAGYTRLLTLSSDFKSFVNTGYKVKADDVIMVRMRVPLDQGSDGSWRVAFGWGNAELFNVRAGATSSASGKYRYQRRDTSARSVLVTDSGFYDRDIVLTCDGKGLKWTLADGTGGAAKSFATVEDSDADTSLYLFSNSQGGDACALTLYSFQVTSSDGTETKLDLVPCISPDGVMGLYNLGAAELPGGNFLGNSGTGSFHSDSEGVVLSSLASSGRNLSVPVDYKVLADDTIRLAMNVPEDQSTARWTVAFGWDDVSIFNLKVNGTSGKYRYQRQGAETLSVVCSEADFYGQDVVLSCNGSGMSWTKADGTGGATHDFSSSVTGDAVLPLCLFSNWKQSDPSILAARSVKITGVDGLLRRNLLPFRRWDGVCGLLDFITGRFYASVTAGTFGEGDDLLAVQGPVAIVREGALPDVDLTGLASLRKVGEGVVSAAARAEFPGLDVREGEMSFVDGEAKEIDVAGALTLNGGAALGIDVTADGCDTLVADRVDLTGTARIIINVTLAAGASIDGRELTIISGGLVAGDDKRFKVRGTGVHCGVTVRDGTLVTCPPSGVIFLVR